MEELDKQPFICPKTYEKLFGHLGTRLPRQATTTTWVLWNSVANFDYFENQ